jgi:hypothetical protein
VRGQVDDRVVDGEEVDERQLLRVEAEVARAADDGFGRLCAMIQLSFSDKQLNDSKKTSRCPYSAFGRLWRVH